MYTKAIQQSHLYLLLSGTAFLLASFMPLTAVAASKKPSCSIEVTTSTGEETFTRDGDFIVRAGEEFEISWDGKDAKDAELDGKEIDVSDSQEFSPRKTTTYEFEFSNGSRKATCEITAHVVDASIDTIQAKAGKPTLKGEADGLKKVTVSVYTTEGKKVFEKKNVSVKKGEWSVKATKTLKDGTYEIRLIGEKKYELNKILTQKLVIGEGSGTITVTTLPLLTGGTIRAGQTQPISYLYLRNTGKEAVQVSGFDVKQNGSANAAVITELSTVDDKGGSRGVSERNPFKNGTAFAPTSAIIEPGTLKLFTIKATLGTGAMIGSNLMLDVTGVQTTGAVQGTFPLRGTTWTVGS